MIRNIVLIILGSLILSFSISVFFVQRMKVRVSNYIWKLMEGSYINDVTIRNSQKFLKLSDEQVGKMMLIDERYNKLEEQYRERYHIYLKGMRDYIFQDYFDEEKIREHLKRIDYENRELRILNLKEIYELEEVLDQDQKNKFRNFLRKLHTRKGKFALPWNMF